jgi:hypothetical protein
MSVLSPVTRLTSRRRRASRRRWHLGAGHVGGGGRDEERDDLGHLGRVGEPAQRGAALDVARAVAARPHGLLHERSGHVPRVHITARGTRGLAPRIASGPWRERGAGPAQRRLAVPGATPRLRCTCISSRLVGTARDVTCAPSDPQLHPVRTAPPAARGSGRCDRRMARLLAAGLPAAPVRRGQARHQPDPVRNPGRGEAVPVSADGSAASFAAMNRSSNTRSSAEASAQRFARLVGEARSP